MFMGDIDQDHFQSNNPRNEHRVLQGNSIGRNETVSYGEAQSKHPLSTLQMMERGV